MRPDGSLLIGTSGVVSLWNASVEGVEFIRDLVGPNFGPYRDDKLYEIAGFSSFPHGGLVVGFHNDRACRPQVRLYQDMAMACEGICTMKWVWRASHFTCVVAMPNGRVVTNCVEDMKAVLMVWNTHLPRETWKFDLWGNDERPDYITLDGHVAEVTCLSVLADGRLASGSADHTVRVWDTTTGECSLVLAEHTEVVAGLSQLYDGRLVSASFDGSLRVWDLSRTSHMVGARSLEKMCNYIAYEYDLPSRAMSGSVNTIQSSFTLESEGFKWPVYCVSVLADGRLASCSTDAMCVWDADTGLCTTTVKLQDSQGVRHLQDSQGVRHRGFSRMRTFLAGLDDGRAVTYLWNNDFTVWM